MRQRCAVTVDVFAIGTERQAAGRRGDKREFVGNAEVMESLCNHQQILLHQRLNHVQLKMTHLHKQRFIRSNAPNSGKKVNEV